MKRRYVWLSLGIGLILFFLLIHNLNWKQAIDVLTIGKRRYLYTYIGVSLLIMLTHALRWRFILRSKGIELPLKKALGYRYASFAVSFVTPGPKVGGEPLRASLLTRHRKVNGRKIKFSESLSTVLADRAAEVQTSALLFFVGILALSVFGRIPAHFKIPLIAASALFFIIVLVFVINTAYGKPFVLQVLKKMPFSKRAHLEMKHFEKTVVSFYRHDRGKFVAAHLFAAISWSLALLEYKYLLLFLGFDLPLWSIFIIYSSVGLAYLVPVPLALGVLEGVQAATFGLLGLSPGAGVILALVTRLRDVLFTITGFMVLVYYGINGKYNRKDIPKAVR